MSCRRRLIPQQKHAPLSVKIKIRGGDSLEEDAELDAYIESLIATVETSEVEPDTAPPGETNNSLVRASDSTSKEISKSKNKSRTKKKAKNSKAQNKSGKVNEKKGKLGSATAESQSLQNEQDEGAALSERIPRDHVDSSKPHTQLATIKVVEEKPDITTSVNETSGVNYNDEIIEPISAAAAAAAGPAAASPLTSSDTMADKTLIPDTRTTTSANARRKPPNALCRFLIRQGIIGRIFAMLLTIVMEWSEAYVPPLAKSVAYLWNRVFPDQEPNRLRVHRPKTVNTMASASVSSQRTGQSEKQRKQLAKQADLIALEQLKRLGSLQDAKYRYVSEAFLRRHSLGRWAKTQTPLAGNGESSIATSARGPLKEARPRLNDEVENVGWILKELRDSPKSLDATAGDYSEVLMNVNRKGDTIISAGRVRRKPTKTRQKLSRQRASDRDGGDGILGRIRAANTSSFSSRKLLGAYPGDAVPLAEAANKRGVIDLARKYGWGEWSDDESKTKIGPQTRRIKSQRKKRESRVIDKRSPFEFEFNLSGSSVENRVKNYTKRAVVRSERLWIDRANTSARKKVPPGNDDTDVLRQELGRRLKGSEQHVPMERVSKLRQRRKRREANDNSD